MSKINPLGSEKLSGDAKIKRIIEIAKFNEPTLKNKKEAEFIQEGINGRVYGIVKEKDGYYVKTGLNENKLDYIGGLFMKNKNKFRSYAEALKRLSLLRGQEMLNEETKYILKKPMSAGNPQDPAPIESEPMPSTEPMVTGGETPMDSSEPQMEPTGDAGGKKSSYMSEIQKFAGKLGQELRDQKDKLESDDLKYVINMVLSAIDLNKIEAEDLDEIKKRFERDDDGELNTDATTPEDFDSMAEVPNEPASDEEVDEIYNRLSRIMKTKKDTNEINLSKYTDLGKVQEQDNEVELDISEIEKNISSAVNDTLRKYFK